ncbi:MAG: exodeoxyribonuclease VII large subunit [Verrucomicrobiia bacterium]
MSDAGQDEFEMLADAVAPAQPKVYTVTELTRKVREVLETEIGEVWVEGEISNFRAQASGHIYFTLKDAGAQLSVVMFRGNAASLKFKLGDGLQVVTFGELSVYEARGQYQLIARRMEPKGYGALQLAFEQLKRKLAAEGLFDAARKKPIPAYPEHIGIVTSPTGAAIRDILNIIERRFPNIHIVIAPARVQGDGAAAEIAAAVDELNALNESGRLPLDVLIVARGGGSIEDLWAFNEEVVARAVARSKIPTISAVGHEIDFTICDFVADLRAPTPSAAAELVVKQRLELAETIAALGQRLERETETALDALKHRLERAASSYVFRRPAEVVRQYQQRVDDAMVSIENAAAQWFSARRGRIEIFGEQLARLSPAARVAQYRQRLENLAGRQTQAMKSWRQERQHALKELSGRLALLSPHNVLNRGYSITTRASDGKVLTAASHVRKGERIRTQLREGEIESDVT